MKFNANGTVEVNSNITLTAAQVEEICNMKRTGWWIYDSYRKKPVEYLGRTFEPGEYGKVGSRTATNTSNVIFWGTF